MNKREIKKRQYWMRLYEMAVVSIDPEQRGKVDWDQATYFYNTGMHYMDAANKATS